MNAGPLIAQTLECPDCDPRWPVTVEVSHCRGEGPVCPHCHSPNLSPQRSKEHTTMTLTLQTTTQIDAEDFSPVFALDQLVPGDVVAYISDTLESMPPQHSCALGTVERTEQTRGGLVVRLSGLAGHFGLDKIRAVKK